MTALLYGDAVINIIIMRMIKISRHNNGRVLGIMHNGVRKVAFVSNISGCLVWWWQKIRPCGSDADYIYFPIRKDYDDQKIMELLLIQKRFKEEYG